MKNSMLKKSVIFSAICLSMGLAISTSHAAGLNTFNNGSVADANDVNHNFNYLDNRIDTTSLTPGPKGDTGAAGATGPQGPTGLTGPAGSQGVAGLNGTNGLDGQDGIDGATGPQGPAGAPGTNGINGTGVIIKSWVGYDNSAYFEKVFVLSDTNGSVDREVQTFNRIGNGTGTIDMTRQRTLLGTVKQHRIIRYNWDNNGGYTLANVKEYDPANTTTLVSTVNISPPIEQLNNAMGIGLRWGTAAKLTETFANSAPNIIYYSVDSRSLLAVEDITVLGVTYNSCLKIETIASSERFGRQRQQIRWYCPGNVGLVKSIQVRSNGTGGVTAKVKELDAAQSTLAL